VTWTWLAYIYLALAVVLVTLLVVANVGGTRAHPPIPNRHQTADAIAMTSLIPRRSVRAIPIRPFTAVSDCPRCDTVAIHPMREAQPFDMGRVVAEVQGDRDKLQAACANVVVRQCSCGQEWRES
jgi:hypothetical protein